MKISNKFLPNSDIHLQMSDAFIERTETHKFLGVTIDHKLKFEVHIDEICNRISKSVGILYKLSKFLESKTLLNIYYALVNSHIMYCNAIWSNTGNVHLNPLVILQKKCLRIVHNSGY